MGNLVRTYKVGSKLKFSCGGEVVEVLVQSKSGQMTTLSINAPKSVKIRHDEPRPGRGPLAGRLALRILPNSSGAGRHG